MLNVLRYLSALMQLAGVIAQVRAGQAASFDIKGIRIDKVDYELVGNVQPQTKK